MNPVRRELVGVKTGCAERDTLGDVGAPIPALEGIDAVAVMGDDVNLAARLMGAAKNGQILLSQLVYDDVSNYFVLDPLPAIKVKGKTKPIPLYQVDGPRDDTLVNRVDSRGPLIGRDKELAKAEKIMAKGLGGACVASPAESRLEQGQTFVAHV